MEIWIRPGPSSIAIARTPGGPPPDSRRPAAIAVPSASVVPGAELEVEGGERRPRRDEDAAAGRVRDARAVVGGEIALAHPPGQLDVAATAKVGALAALRRARQLAVEEDRQGERAEPLGDRVGEVDRSRPERLVVPDDRTDVDRADPRVRADLTGDVDQPDREVGEADECRQQRRLVTGEGEDGAVVDRIGVLVE